MTASAERAVQTLGNLPTLTDQGIGIAMYAICSASAGYVSYAIHLSPDAGHDLAEIAQRSRTKVASSTLVEYAPATLVAPQHVMHVAQDAAATLSVIQSVVVAADQEPFNPRAPYASSVAMVAAHFTTSTGQSATFYRVADTLLQMRRRSVFGLVRTGGQYDRLDPADVLLLRPTFDVVVVDGYAFFSKKPTFERAFGFLDRMRQASAATFESVTTSLRIEGFDALRAACTSQPQMMAKMASIKRSMEEDPAYAAAMTMPKIIAFIDAHPHLGVKTTGTGDDRVLVFEASPQTRFQILKLLDDDYLQSVLTDRGYEAGSKIRSD